MTIAQITGCLEALAPLGLQEEYDNAGLSTGHPDMSCTGVLCTLDVTASVVEEAVKKNCNCIVAHHPLIFRGIKKLTAEDHTGRALIAAIKNDIAIYACHTNIDNVMEGVNGRIADKLGLVDRAILEPLTGFRSELQGAKAQVGAGLIGTLEKQSEPEFFRLLQQQFHLQVIRHTPLTGRKISKVAVCGGSGSFLVSKALAEGAEVFVSADMKYHEFFEAAGRMVICDIGHYESEQFTTDLFIEILLQKFPTFAVLKSEVKTNPVNYFTGK